MANFLLKATPPEGPHKGACTVCKNPLSVWTRDKITTQNHPNGFPVCKPCRDRLAAGYPSEHQAVVETLGAMGETAVAALPAIRKVSGTYDPFLRTACQVAFRQIRGKADSRA